METTTDLPPESTSSSNIPTATFTEPETSTGHTTSASTVLISSDAEVTTQVDICHCPLETKMTFESGLAIGIGVILFVFFLHILFVVIFRRRVGKLLLGIRSTRTRKNERFKNPSKDEMPVALDVMYDDAVPYKSYSDLENLSRGTHDPNEYSDLSRKYKGNKEKPNPALSPDDDHLYDLAENQYSKPVQKKNKKLKEKKEKRKRPICKPAIEIPPTPGKDVAYEEAWPNYCDLDNKTRFKLQPKEYYDLHMMKENVQTSMNKSSKTPDQGLENFYELEKESVFSNVEIRHKANKKLDSRASTAVYEEFDTRLEPKINSSKPKRPKNQVSYEPVSLEGNKFALYDDARTSLKDDPSDVKTTSDDETRYTKAPFNDDPAHADTNFYDDQSHSRTHLDGDQSDACTPITGDPSDAITPLDDDLSDESLGMYEDDTAACSADYTNQRFYGGRPEKRNVVDTDN